MGVVPRFATALLAIAGCYSSPRDASCKLSCDVQLADPCPNGLACSNGFCAQGGDVCNSDGGVVPDSPGRDGNPGEFCLGTAPELCFPSMPTGSPTITNILPSSICPDERTLPGDIDICVFAGNTITLSGNLVFTGNRAVVIVGVSSIVVEPTATIDVGSRANQAGAGANPGVCGMLNVSAGAAGGAGGSFGALGGVGGLGGRPTATPDGFHGGCPGHAGSGPTKGGDGGGAIHFLSNGTIAVNGGILASGGGGAGGAAATSNGGGGGGSGGYVGFDAPSILLTNAKIVATGGGGGQGAGQQDAGESGHEGTLDAPLGEGGFLNGTGGQGGGGGVFGGGTTGVSANTGGGGGGGTGVIRHVRDTDVSCPQCKPLPTSPGS